MERFMYVSRLLLMNKLFGNIFGVGSNFMQRWLSILKAKGRTKKLSLFKIIFCFLEILKKNLKFSNCFGVPENISIFNN